jgi:hypothetical protein
MTATLLYFADEVLEFIHSARSDHHARTRLSEREREMIPDAARCTCYQCGVALEVE